MKKCRLQNTNTATAKYASAIDYCSLWKPVKVVCRFPPSKKNTNTNTNANTNTNTSTAKFASARTNVHCGNQSKLFFFFGSEH